MNQKQVTLPCHQCLFLEILVGKNTFLFSLLVTDLLRTQKTGSGSHCMKQAGILAPFWRFPDDIF